MMAGFEKGLGASSRSTSQQAINALYSLMGIRWQASQESVDHARSLFLGGLLGCGLLLPSALLLGHGILLGSCLLLGGSLLFDGGLLFGRLKVKRE